jgi:hypothetical protein
VQLSSFPQRGFIVHGVKKTSSVAILGLAFEIKQVTILNCSNDLPDISTSALALRF